ncbi:hypothetical protein BGX34_008081 [Mortierella sp. NVP85]|nr:hypothetical protein BGX34_008081 [Mortierella sp. NVP85]
MWKVSRIGCAASGLRHPARSYSSSWGLLPTQSPSSSSSLSSYSSAFGYRGFRSGTGKALNGNASESAGGASNANGSGKLVGDRITIDQKSKMRMDLRAETMGNNHGGNKSGGNSDGDGSGSGIYKWAKSPDHEARAQGSPFRRTIEEARNRPDAYRDNRLFNSNGSGMQNEGRQQGGRRPGRYYEERSGGDGSGSRQERASHQNDLPSSFATSSAWGFSAPAKPAKKPKAPKPFQKPVGEETGKASTSGSGAPSSISLDSFLSKPTTSTYATSTSTASAPAAAPASAASRPVTSTPLPRPVTSASSTPWPAPSTHASSRFSAPMRDNVKRQIENQARRRRQLRKQQKPAKDVFIPDAISVSNLAGLLGARIGHFENKMRSLGMETTRHDHILTSEEASLLALEYNVNPIVGTTEKLFDLTPKPEPEDMSIYPLRPPVVTIMGHVDHGKTTLLDSLRKTSVAAGEAGGITQHIGAFSVTLPSKQQITFLDTPGHAAFSAMRARGAHTTDIVVLVVAAEDGVMPQTVEAIKHAEEAGVPIVVAINKCDKYGAEPEKAKQALLKYGITVEDLGGETQCVEVSGLTGMNLDKLEETILTLAEVLDLRAEVDMKGEGHVIESQIEKGRGSVATVLVKRGTLRVGDNIVAGDTWCKVKALVNDQGKAVKEAPPGTPVKVMGWKDLPKAGDEMLGAESEEQAKLVVENRMLKRERREQLKTLVAINEKRRIVAEEEDEEKTALRDYKHKVWLFHQGILEHHPEQPQVKKQLSVAAMAAKEEEESEVKHLRMVVKGDVSGTVEAVCDALSGLPANQVKVGVIQSGVGNITESDIQFASSCSAMILGFNVKADKKLQQTARVMGVNIKSYGVIYKLLDDVKVEMAMLLPKDIEIQVVGEAKVAQVFPIKMKGGQTQNVAGCRVTNGGVSRKEDIRIVRDGEVIWDGRLSSLKRVKEDIQEAKKGTECGMEFEGFQDFKEGDMIQSLKKVEVLRKL